MIRGVAANPTWRSFKSLQALTSLMTSILKLTLFAALGAAAFNGQADQPSWRVLCDKISGLAENVMSARQSGVPMAKMMKEVNGGVPELEQMIVDAYDTPRYMSYEVRRRA